LYLYISHIYNLLYILIDRSSTFGTALALLRCVNGGQDSNSELDFIKKRLIEIETRSAAE